MNFRFPQRDEISGFAKSPVVAVDLGFAERARSCGLALQTPGGEPVAESLEFGRCAEKTASFLSNNANSVLIVEAPLSGLLNAHGNPMGRKVFEKMPIGGKTVSRDWYTGAGAAVGLGAMFFFSRLALLLRSSSGVVNVVEGFVSFKRSRSKDEEDALALLNGLRRPDSAVLHEVEAGEGEQRVNMLALLGLASEKDPCPVVMVTAARQLA